MTKDIIGIVYWQSPIKSHFAVQILEVLKWQKFRARRENVVPKIKIASKSSPIRPFQDTIGLAVQERHTSFVVRFF